MVHVHADEKARVCLTREVIERYGQDFVLVPAKNELILIPVSKNPLKSFQEEGKKISPHLTVKDLKRMINEEAEMEALSALTRKK